MSFLNHKDVHSDLAISTRPPGCGLLTISTGTQDAQEFLKKYFARKASKAWKAPKKLKSQHCYLLGYPCDSGAGIMRGSALGPLALRKKIYAQVSSWKDYDLGDIPCIPNLLHDDMLNTDQKKYSGQALWGDCYKNHFPVAPLNILEEFLVQKWEQAPSFVPLVLGGDHGLSGAVFRALNRVNKTEKLAVLHFDAHTDLLRERFGVRHCFATWAAHSVGFLSQPEAWIQLGIRASTQNKKHWEAEFKLKQFWAETLHSQNAKDFAFFLLQHWKALGCTHLYVSFDIDALDAGEAPSTGTPEFKGLKSTWCANVLKALLPHIPLVGADLVEVAPKVGSRAESNRTLNAAYRIFKCLTESGQSH